MTLTAARKEPMNKGRTSESVGMTFPFKLFEMLEDVEKEGNTSMVSWRHHGHSFTVHEPDVFVEKIMPYYFNQSKYKSFQRQLNLYGFVCIPRGEDKGAYFHKNFVRGERYLCHYVIRRKDLTRTTTKWAGAAEAAARPNKTTSNKDASLQVREQQSSSQQQSNKNGAHSVQVSILANCNLSSGMNQEALPVSSLQIRQQEAITHLNRQRTKGDLLLAPTPDAPLLVLSSGESSEEDGLRMFNSTEVDPLDCPSVTLFDDEEQDIQINRTGAASPDPQQQNMDEGELFQDEIDSLTSCFDDDPPQTPTSNAIMVPQYVKFPTIMNKSGDFSFCASNDDNYRNQDLGDVNGARPAGAFYLNENDTFQREAPKAGSNGALRPKYELLQEDYDEAVATMNSTILGGTAFDRAMQKLHFKETSLSVDLASLLAAQNINLNWDEIQALTRISLSEFEEFCACCIGSGTGSRDYSCRKQYEGEQDECLPGANTQPQLRHCVRP